MSRSKAKSTLELGDFDETMTRANVTARVEFSTLDESPMAYKDIFEVMRMQQDLVEVQAHVKPIINIKG
jgi:tRNA-splicing ligase RtcB